MLTITTINYIRELYFSEGKSFSDISTMTGKNYRTIRKYIEKEDFNESLHKADRPNRSDVLRPIIRKWLMENKSSHRKQKLTATRVFELLQEHHHDILDVKERTVRTIVKEIKDEIYEPRKAYLRLVHPGGEAQVDFGEFQAYEDGVLKKFHELILSFPKSNAGYAVATRSETREALFEGLVDIFSHIGHVPSAIWFDQMASAALRTKDEHGNAKAAGMALRFASHYGFNIKFCNANSGHEKGNVENKVGTLRRNLFVPEPSITDINAFNKELLVRCDKLNQKPHYRMGTPMNELLEDEKAKMMVLNPIAFDTARYESRKVNKYGLIDFSGCRYSASPKYVGEWVSLKITANNVEIYDKTLSKKISVHPRLFEVGTESVHYIDFIDMVKARPTALKYSGVYALLPESWQDYLQSLPKESYGKAFDALKMILIEDDLEFADKVLMETMLHDSVSPEAVVVTYKRLKENRLVYDSEILFSSDLPGYLVDISQYDLLIGGGLA